MADASWVMPLAVVGGGVVVGSARAVTTNSTRRLAARPAAVWLSLSGCVSP